MHRSAAGYPPDSDPPFKGTPDAKVSTTFKVIIALIVTAVSLGVYGENLRGKLERMSEHTAAVEVRQANVERKVDDLRDALRDMASSQKMYLRYLVDRKGPKPTEEAP